MVFGSHRLRHCLILKLLILMPGLTLLALPLLCCVWQKLRRNANIHRLVMIVVPLLLLYVSQWMVCLDQRWSSLWRGLVTFLLLSGRVLMELWWDGCGIAFLLLSCGRCCCVCIVATLSGGVWELSMVPLCHFWLLINICLW